MISVSLLATLALGASDSKAVFSGSSSNQFSGSAQSEASSSHAKAESSSAKVSSAAASSSSAAAVSSGKAAVSSSGKAESSAAHSDNSASSAVPPLPNQDAGCMLESFPNAVTGVDDVANLMFYTLVGPQTVGITGSNDTMMLSPCASQQLGNCSTKAFAARFNAAGNCIASWNQIKTKTTFDAKEVAFSLEVAGVAQAPLTIDIACDPLTLSNANMTANVLTVGSSLVCAEIKQADIKLAPGVCHADFEKKGANFEASLSTFSDEKTKTTKTGTEAPKPTAISPCGKVSFADNKDLNNCPATPGYMAYNGADGQCVVLDKKEISYDPNALEFNSTFYNGTLNFLKSGLLGAENNKRVVIVKCGSTTSTEGVQDGDTITYTSTSVCGTPKAAEAPKEDDEGLSTGAIVGIVIGVLALIVIVLVICRWKSAKTEEEGEYSRV